MEGRCQCKRKVVAIDRFTNPSTFEFLYSNLEHKKVPPYPGDIWVPSLFMAQNKSVNFFNPCMESLFKDGNRLIRVEHVSVILKPLSWN
jgi:hypothetical protein